MKISVVSLFIKKFMKVIIIKERVILLVFLCTHLSFIELKLFAIINNLFFDNELKICFIDH